MKLTVVRALIVLLTVIALQVSDAETIPTQPQQSVEIKFEYHNYENITHFLKRIESIYGNLTHLYSIGKSVEGRDLWVMAISAMPNTTVIQRPEVKYVGNIHGNEVVGREMLLHFIHMLVTDYGRDPAITWLLDNTRIHILPNMNPDGSEVSKQKCLSIDGRSNARKFDLNRNFPDSNQDRKQRIQPETRAIMNWLQKYQFVLSGSMHGGALVATYPFDNKKPEYQNPGSSIGVSTDDDVFRHLAYTYSKNHRLMRLGEPCPPYVQAFENGITNGASWYSVTGGMQDYNYIYGNCMEITLELGCCKYPKENELSNIWEDNREALIKFLAEAHRGIKGVISTNNGKPIVGASVEIEGRKIGFKTTKNGEFWRILLPGSYKIKIEADGYRSLLSDFKVTEENQPLILNLSLDPLYIQKN